MEVLSSRVLLRPRLLEASRHFYRDLLGLHVYREWRGGVVFFLGGGFLELSGQAEASVGTPTMQLWLQVRDVEQAHRDLSTVGVSIVEPPTEMPWGLREMRISDPDGVILVLVEVPEDHPLRRRA